MGRFTVRRALTFAAALLAGAALALPIASASNSASTTSSGTTGTTGTGTTGTTGTTSTTGTTGTTPTETATTPPTTTSTTPPPSSPSKTPAPAGRPPRVGAASVLHTAPTSATIAAGIDPEGLATGYRIQYGPTPAYGAQTGASAGGGSAEVKVTHAITGLTPNTTYHFRVVASNSAGATLGRDATLTTAKIPPTLTASVAPGEVAFGRPLTLVGAVSGPESAGVEVVVQENPYPYDRGFQNVTDPQPVDGAGRFSFALPGLFESAQLRVATAAKPLAYSAPVSELVRVRVTLRARPSRRRGWVRLTGTVTPSEPGARVAFERSQRGGYVVVSGTKVKGRAGTSSRFARIVRVRRRGRYRALVSLAAGALAPGRSPAVTVR